MIKKVLAILALNVLLVCSASRSVVIGGYIPVIQSVTCKSLGNVDFSKPGKNIPIATCVINNNLPSYEVVFELGPYMDLSFLSKLTLRQKGGTLGDGIQNPTGKDMLHELSGNRFTWKPEAQSTSTIDYEVDICASWKAQHLISSNNLPLTTVLTAEL